MWVISVTSLAHLIVPICSLVICGDGQNLLKAVCFKGIIMQQGKPCPLVLIEKINPREDFLQIDRVCAFI